MRTIKIESKKLEYGLIIACLFLSSMNFYAKFFYFVFAAFLIFLFLSRKIEVTWSTLLYLSLGAFMAVYNADEGILSMLRCLAYVFCYIIGGNIVMDASKLGGSAKEKDLQSQRTAYGFLISICLGSFVHFMLNFLTNRGTTIGRNTIDIWTGSVMAATVQAAIACCMTGFSVAMILCPMKRKQRLYGIIAILGIMLYNLMLAGRTLIVIFLVVFLVGFVYFLTDRGDNIRRRKTLFALAGLASLALLLYLFNAGGIRDYVEGSNLLFRFGGSDKGLLNTERTNSKMLFLRDFWTYPFGGLHMQQKYGVHAHDLLLDAYDEYGIIELILLVMILAAGIWKLLRLCRNKDFHLGYRMAFLCVYIAILLEFTVEPIFEAAPWLFVNYALINGCVDGLNRVYLRNHRGGTCS